MAPEPGDDPKQSGAHPESATESTEETRSGLSAADDVADNAAADVDAFVRLARASVNRLVSDPAIAAELHASIADPSSDLIERLVSAQRMLSRVLAYERATLGSPIGVADVEALLGRDQIDFEEGLYLVYELSLSGGRSWSAVSRAVADASAETSEQSRAEPRPGTDPLLRALRWLTRRPEAGDVSGALRHALHHAVTSPLGFCRLVLEVADDASGEELASGFPVAETALDRVATYFGDPFLRSEAPEPWFDLRARCAVYLADHARRSGRLAACDAQMASLPELLASGTGEPGLRARVEELRAGRDLADGDRDAALEHLDGAEQILADAQARAGHGQDPEQAARASHRLVEVRLKRGLILAADPARRARARDEMAQLAGSFDAAKRRGADARLRLRVLLAAARVELDLARQEVAESNPLGPEASSPDASARLSAYAKAWQDRAGRLQQAGRWLHSASDLLGFGGDHARAEYDWYFGQSLLLTDRRRAAEQLRSALAKFQDLDDAATVDQISIDLIVCGVLAGALGDQVEDWSEPLDLFRRLAARTGNSS